MANVPIGAGTTVLCDCAVGVPVKLVILGGDHRAAWGVECGEAVTAVWRE